MHVSPRNKIPLIFPPPPIHKDPGLHIHIFQITLHLMCYNSTYNENCQMPSQKEQSLQLHPLAVDVGHLYQ